MFSESMNARFGEIGESGKPGFEASFKKAPLMSGPEWEKVKVIFDAALAVAEEEREAFLKSACDSHPNLYSTVLNLLRNHTETSLCLSQNSGPIGSVFEPGNLVGERFRVVRFVSRGGMGEVYECDDEALGNRVALKTLKPELLDDTRAVARFKREIQVARGVSHHNVCRIHELVEHVTPSGRRIPCLTMEFLEGETLAAAIVRLRPFQPSRAFPLILQIAAGLEALHARNVLHRDLKPSNIMLVPERDGSTRAVLMDFGLAKIRESSSNLFETSVQPLVAGAPYFMAPELLRGQRPSIASDLYSLGLVVDELVTNSRAFSAVSLQALYYAKLWESPIPPGERSDSLPREWNAAILRCIDANPDQRFATATALVDALTTDLPFRNPSLPRLVRRGWLLARWVAHRPAMIAAGLTFGISVAVAAVMMWMPSVPVAIFNIRNLTGEPTYNYLATGFTSELSRRLTLVPGIRALPIHAASSPAAVSPVRFALDGELRSVGGGTSLTVWLKDQKRSTPLWFGTFDAQQLSNPLQVESKTLLTVVSNIEAAASLPGAVLFLRSQPPVVALSRRWDKVSGHAVASLRSPTGNNNAFDDYMRGRQLSEQMSPEAIRNGLNLLERAVSEDSSFALAYAALANASVTMMNWNYLPQKTLLANGNSFSQTAVELDPNLPEALQSRALVRQTQWNWSGAREDYLLALKLKPTFAVARRYYAVLVTLMGDPEEGVRQSRLALAADPYDESALPGHALILYISGRLQEAARTLENAPHPDNLGVRRNLGETYALLGAQASGDMRERYFRQALDQADKVRQIEIRSQHGLLATTPESDRMFAHFLAIQGKTQACQPWLLRAEADFRQGLISPAMLAWIYTALGRKQQALDLLDRAVKERDRHMILAKVYPFLNPLREDVRFQRLIAQMGL